MLTNKSDSTKSKCNNCKDLLTHSNWRNEKVFLSIELGFLCIRCIRDMVTDRKLDNFVKKNNGGIIPPLPSPIISKRRIKKIIINAECKINNHTNCENIRKLCQCKCHHGDF